MTSLGVGLGRWRNGLKGEIEKVMTSWRLCRITSGLQAFLDKTISVEDHKHCKICHQSSK